MIENITKCPHRLSERDSRDEQETKSLILAWRTLIHINEQGVSSSQ